MRFSKLTLLAAPLLLALSGCHPDDGPCDELGSDDKISQACAVELAADSVEILRERSLEGVVTYRWPVALQTSDVISEGLREDLAEDPLTGDVTAPASSSRDVPVHSASWFFFVDLEPGKAWNHRSAFVLVDRDTGVATVIERNSYPRVNGVTSFASQEDLAREFAKIPELSGSAGAAPRAAALTFTDPTPTGTGLEPANGPLWDEYMRRKGSSGLTQGENERNFQGVFEKNQTDASTAAELGKCSSAPDCDLVPHAKYALLIEGGQGISAKPLRELGTYLRGQGWDTVVMTSDSPDVAPVAGMPFPPETVTTKGHIQKAFTDLAGKVKSCCDEVLIVIRGHGTPLGAIMMNPLDTDVDWERVEREGWGQSLPTKATGHADGGPVGTLTLKTYFNSIKSCRVKIFIHSCYAGKHLERGLNQLNDRPQDPGPGPGCLCRVVAVSSSARQTSMFGGDLEFMKKMKAGGSFDESFAEYKKQYGHKTDTNRMEASEVGAYTPQVQATDCALCLDGDGDGLTTGEELQWGTDPTTPDWDGDFIPDGTEVHQYKTHPKKKDSDDDKVDDLTEIERGMDPNHEDSDRDGLNDNYELLADCEPLVRDTDGDGLLDGDEFNRTRTLCRNKDTDGDTYWDSTEDQAGTDPNDKLKHP